MYCHSWLPKINIYSEPFRIGPLASGFVLASIATHSQAAHSQAGRPPVKSAFRVSINIRLQIAQAHNKLRIVDGLTPPRLHPGAQVQSTNTRRTGQASIFHSDFCLFSTMNTLTRISALSCLLGIAAASGSYSSEEPSYSDSYDSYEEYPKAETRAATTGIGWGGWFGYPSRFGGYPIAGSFPVQKPGYGDLTFRNYGIGYYAPYNYGGFGRMRQVVCCTFGFQVTMSRDTGNPTCMDRMAVIIPVMATVKVFMEVSFWKCETTDPVFYRIRRLWRPRRWLWIRRWSLWPKRSNTEKGT